MESLMLSGNATALTMAAALALFGGIVAIWIRMGKG